MRQKLIQRLKSMELQRQQVEELEQALRQLTPAQQLVLHKLLVDREPMAVLCQLLEVEPATVYRWKDKALSRLEEILGYC